MKAAQVNAIRTNYINAKNKVSVKFGFMAYQPL